MMKLFHKKLLTLLSSVLMVLFLAACSESTTTEIDNIGPGKERVEVPVEQLEGDHFELLQQASEEYLQNANFETITSEQVYNMLTFGSEEEFLIVDVRDPVTYASGHIEGSVNIAYKNTANLKQISDLPRDKKIIVVCYSGHTASQVVALWNMLGYEAIVMENGMGSWTKDTALASTIPTTTLDFEVVQESNEASATYDLPTVSVEEATDISSLLTAVSKQYLTSEKKTIISATDLKEKIDNNDSKIVLIDVRDQADYQKGHITKSINIPIKELASKENLAKLPTDKTIVLIGYNGYEASQATRILSQMGYDALTMYSGMRIWHSDRLLTGIDPISSEKLAELPTVGLNYNIGGEPTAAG